MKKSEIHITVVVTLAKMASWSRLALLAGNGSTLAVTKYQCLNIYYIIIRGAYVMMEFSSASFHKLALHTRTLDDLPEQYIYLTVLLI